MRFCLHNYHDGKFHLRNGSVYFTTLLEIVVNGIGGRVAILVGGHPVAYSLARPSVSSLPADHQPELLSKIRESPATGELVSFCVLLLGDFIHRSNRNHLPPSTPLNVVASAFVVSCR